MKNVFLLIILCIVCFRGTGQEPKLVLPEGHKAKVYSAFFSPDNNCILTSGDKTAKLWDANSGLLLTELTSQSYVYKAIFSPDGSRIVTVSEDKTIVIWNSKNGLKENVLTGHTDYVNLVLFTPDGKNLITSSADNSIRIWNFIDGKEKYNFINAHKNSIKNINLSADGSMLVSASKDNTAKVWDIKKGILLFELIGQKGEITNAVFSPDNQKIVTTSRDGSVFVWDAKTGTNILKLAVEKRNVYDAKFSNDGKKIITASEYSAKIWDALSGQMLHNCKNGYDEILSIAISPDRKKFAATSSDNNIIIWDIENGLALTKFQGHKKKVGVPIFSSKGDKLLTYSEDCTAKVWESNSGKIIFELESKMKQIEGAFFLKDDLNIITLGKRELNLWNKNNGTIKWDISGSIGKLPGSIIPVDRNFIHEKSKRIITIKGDTAAVINIESGETIFNIIENNTNISNACFSNQGNLIATGSYKGIVRIWNSITGSQIASFSLARESLISCVSFSPDDKKVAIALDNNSIEIYDIENKKIDFKLTEGVTQILQDGFVKSAWINSINYSPNGLYLAAAGDDKVVRVWDVKNGLLVNSFKDHTSKVQTVQFSPDGSLIITASQDNTARIWHVEQKKMIAVLRHNNWILGAFFSKDGTKAITFSGDNYVSIWNVNDGSKIATLKHSLAVKYASLSSNDKILITVAEDNCMRFWDLEKFKLKYSKYTIDKNNHFFQSSTGHFFTTKYVSKLLHYVTKDLKVITFEQLDVKYNRPDKVLEAMGSTDSALINSYRKAYQKRIKKLGIDTTQFKDGYSVPESDFINRDAIEYEQTKDKLTLKIKAIDSSYKLERFNVWVNEVPLFGLRGIKTKRSNNFDTTITITLSQGENRIETSVININGTESYKMPLFVKYTPVKPIEEKQYFIGIGINQFANADYNLSWSVKDIRDLALKLKSKYPNIMIDTLFDNNVTKENILALKQKLLQLKEDDKVIVSYSGHGVLSKDFDYYLSTYSINFNNPAEMGLAYDDLESLLDNIKPRKKLMLIDACHSGEVDKEEIAKIEASTKELNNKGVSTKSSIKVIPKKNLGMANSFELMQNLFVNVGKGTGATIISAAGGMQYAQERGDLKNGVFTYSLIEAFNQNTTLKVSELKKKVSERVTQLTNGLQKPTSRNETNNFDWVIW